MTTDILLSVLPPMSLLNQWARCSFEQKGGMDKAGYAIYGYKRRIIHAAIKLGMCSMRIVSVERPCKTCNGTGEFRRYDWQDEGYWQGEDCRRCGATGKVMLRFVESTIARHRWHTPRPKWDLGIFEEKDWSGAPTAGGWEPEQPGQPLGIIELVENLNAVERVLLPELTPYESWPSPHSKLPPYILHLGKLRFCPFCGKEETDTIRPIHEIYRPAFKWLQDPCCTWGDSACVMPQHSAPFTWPHDIVGPRDMCDPQWTERVPIPDVAHHPAITEWLQRRGIVIGHYPPDECAWTPDGALVKVMAIRDRTALVKIYDSRDWLYRYDDESLIPLPEASLRRRRRGGPWESAPPVDYPELTTESSPR